MNTARLGFAIGLLLLASPASGRAARPQDDDAAALLRKAAAIEDEALQHKSRGRYPEALDAFLRAAELLGRATVAAPAEGGRPVEPLIAARAGVYLLAADHLATRADRIAATRERLDRLAADVGDPILKARVDSLRRGYAQRMGDFKAVDELTRDLGFVTDWEIIGPFDNERGRGFSVAHPPESEIDF